MFANLDRSIRIPFLPEEAYQWYESFDLATGDVLRSPDPTRAFRFLDSVVEHLLSSECGWTPERIHWFGFAQGGSVASEYALRWWRASVGQTSTRSVFRSVITVGGPLLSLPTVMASTPRAATADAATSASGPGTGAVTTTEGVPATTVGGKCPTPVLVQHGPGAFDVEWFRRAYVDVRSARGRGEGMPASQGDWEPLMRFWSERLVHTMAPSKDLYHVMTS